MAKAKVVNYTPEQTARAVTLFTAADSDESRKVAVEVLAAEFGKSPASIRAKLVREGAYKAPAKVGKKGGVKKSALVDSLVAMVPMADNDAESLTKATMSALKAVVEALTPAQPDVFEGDPDFVDSE